MYKDCLFFFLQFFSLMFTLSSPKKATFDGTSFMFNNVKLEELKI